MAIIKNYSYLKAKILSASDVALLDDIGEIKKAFKNIDRIKSGKLNGRPAEELFNKL